MCGITGFWSARGLADDAKPKLQTMVKTLYHRGPDGEGYHIDQDAGVAMGHSRLSIIDLHTGNQPLFSFDKQITLTVNGEFYDYKRLRANLICDGEKFKTKSDSEIAIPLYQKHGLDFVHRLRGEFAFALFDKKKDRMVLVRDRFGIRPLFYHIHNGVLYYGSEIKSLLAHPRVQKEFCPKALTHQLMHTMVPGTSLFKNIHALKPGHMLIVQRKGDSFDITQQRYWDLEFPTIEDTKPPQPDQHYIDLVQEKLLESVLFRLEADVPVGCYLSGGIDSCSMLGLAASVQQSPVKAFTISFDHDAYDEASIAKEMAEKTSADQELLNLEAGDLYGENYRKTVWHSERTFYNTLGVAKWCMSKRVRENGYKVVVTGEGSDELFGGYPMFKRDMFLHGLDGDDSTAMQKKLEESNKLFKGAILAEDQMHHPAMESVCGFTPSWIQPWMQTLAIAKPLLHDDIQSELGDYDPIEAIADSFDHDMIDGRHPLDIAQYSWSKTMLECQILNWGGDRVDMANSMESRPAFLDHHVAESTTQIPPTVRIREDVEKWVLREAMKNLLPEVLYKREKFAFMAPPGHTEIKKQQAVDRLIQDQLNPNEVERTGIFDKKRIQTFVDEYKRDTDSVSLTRKDALLNHLLCLQILHQQYMQNSL